MNCCCVGICLEVMIEDVCVGVVWLCDQSVHVSLLVTVHCAAPVSLLYILRACTAAVAHRQTDTQAVDNGNRGKDGHEKMLRDITGQSSDCECEAPAVHAFMLVGSMTQVLDAVLAALWRSLNAAGRLPDYVNRPRRRAAFVAVESTKDQLSDPAAAAQATRSSAVRLAEQHKVLFEDLLLDISVTCYDQEQEQVFLSSSRYGQPSQSCHLIKQLSIIDCVVSMKRELLMVPRECWLLIDAHTDCQLLLIITQYDINATVHKNIHLAGTELVVLFSRCID